jgi:hypothetical protein
MFEIALNIRLNLFRHCHRNFETNADIHTYIGNDTLVVGTTYSRGYCV